MPGRLDKYLDLLEDPDEEIVVVGRPNVRIQRGSASHPSEPEDFFVPLLPAKDPMKERLRIALGVGVIALVLLIMLWKVSRWSDFSDTVSAANESLVTEASCKPSQAPGIETDQSRNNQLPKSTDAHVDLSVHRDTSTNSEINQLLTELARSNTATVVNDLQQAMQLFQAAKDALTHNNALISDEQLLHWVTQHQTSQKRLRYEQERELRQYLFARSESDLDRSLRHLHHQESIKSLRLDKDAFVKLQTARDACWAGLTRCLVRTSVLGITTHVLWPMLSIKWSESPASSSMVQWWKLLRALLCDQHCAAVLSLSLPSSNLLLATLEAYGLDICWVQCTAHIIGRCVSVGVSMLVVSMVGQMLPLCGKSALQSLVVLIMSAFFLSDESLFFLQRLAAVEAVFAVSGSAVLLISFRRARREIDDNGTSTKLLNQWLGYADSIAGILALCPLLLVPLCLAWCRSQG